MSNVSGNDDSPEDDGDQNEDGGHNEDEDGNLNEVSHHIGRHLRCTWILSQQQDGDLDDYSTESSGDEYAPSSDLDSDFRSTIAAGPSL